MGLGNGNAKSGNKGSGFNFQHRNLILLGEILAATSGGGGGGGSTEATQLLVKAAVEAIEASNDLIVTSNASIATNINADTWDTTIGNSKVLSYYAGSGVGHPATTTTEVETIEFRKDAGATLVFTQTFTYDAENNVLTIIVS